MPHDPHLAERMRQALARPGASPMDITGRPMKGFVWVQEGSTQGQTLERWIDLAEQFVGHLPPK